MIWTVFAVIWLLWLPGALLTRLFRTATSSDPLLNLAEQIGLSIVFWPVLFLWTTTLGWHWSQQRAFIVALLIGISGLLALLVVPPSQWIRRWHRLQKFDLWLILFGLLFVYGFQTRIAHIQSLVLPNWVDSIHHVMLIRLLVEQGTLPDTYAPFMPTGQFFYHWGYHAVVAWFSWFLNQTDAFAIAQQVLSFGQILNTLSFLMLYAAGRFLFQSRRAGFLTVILGGFISWFPAYYTSWGRYTHLLGVLILVPLSISLWRLHRKINKNLLGSNMNLPGRGHKVLSIRKHFLTPSRKMALTKLFPLGQWFTVILLATGLFLIHIRVTFFALTFAIVLALWLLIRQAWPTIFAWCLAGVGAVILLLPWLPTLFRYTQLPQIHPLATGEAQAGWQLYNTIPWNLVWVPGVHEVMALATVGMSGIWGWGSPDLWLRIASGGWLTLILGILFYQVWRPLGGLSAPPWMPIILLTAWSIITFIFLNLHFFGLPSIGFIHNSSAVITLFAPLSLAGGGLLAWGIGCLSPKRWVPWITTIFIIAIGGWGGYDMQKIINDNTILTHPDDLHALHWIRENTPADAKFAINAHRWLANTYAGQDAGYWVSVLTDRETIVPPALYAIAEHPETVQQRNDLLQIWAQSSSLDSPQLQMALQNAGVTHLYIGEKGGHIDVSHLLTRPDLRLIYKNGLVYIFEFQ